MTALRQWQADCLEKIVDYVNRGQRNFLTVATPGAGKTTLALTAASELIKKNAVSRIVIIVPSRHLKRQWTKAAAQKGIALSRRLSNDALADGLPNDVVGYVATYSQVANFPDVHEALCLSRNTLVILDEVHHAGDDKAWGAAICHAFDEASFVLSLSGTPFRSDDCRIPFITYENNTSKADYKYGYGRAIIDDVCRSVIFPSFEGEMEWSAAGEIVKATFDDELDESGASRRLRTALSVNSNLLVEMLGRAVTRLEEIRQNGHPDAGGLVLAIDQEHAHQIAGLMRRKFGVEPTVALSDDAEASEKISDFAEGAAPWLIAVRMVSEGVDIPRLRVGVYATNISERLFFRQAVGRFVRNLPGLDEQTAYVFLPRHPPLIAEARAIQEERDHVLSGQDKQERESRESDGDRDMSGAFLPLSAIGQEGEHILNGEGIDAETIRRAQEIKRKVPGCRFIPDAVIAQILIASGGQWPGEQPATQIEDPNDANERVRKALKRVIGAIAYKVMDPPDRSTYQQINRALNDQVGIDRMDQATLGQIERKLVAAQNMLASIGRRGDAA